MPPMNGAEKFSGKVVELVLGGCVVALAGFIGMQVLATRGNASGEAAGAIATTIATTIATAPQAKARSARSPQSAGTLAPYRAGFAEPNASGLGSRAAAATDGAEGTDDAGERTTDLEGGDSEPGTLVTRLPSSRGLSDAGTVREMRRRVSTGAEGTYIAELLASRDSALARWPDRLAKPLRVWVQETDTLQGWHEDFVPAVRGAFDSWSAAGIPVRFDFVVDSASADVHVRFTSRLANGISGKTVWSRDGGWWLVAGDIQLAVEHPSGGVVSPSQMRAIALHEVGHLLGLDHSSSVEDIMSARVRVRELSDADRGTVRLLYSMPAGSIK